MSIGLGIDPFQSLMAQQQQAYLNSIAQQQAAALGLNQYPSQYQSALAQNVAQSGNPDERLLVLLTEE